jgi:hypothetical protein
MDRSTFLLVAGAMAIIFSLNMMFMGSQMLKMVIIPTNQSTLMTLQWMGSQLFAIGILTVAARHDPGSPALRAVLIGTLVLHAGGLAWDLVHYVRKYVNRSAVIMGLIVHVPLGGGAAYYLMHLG